MVERFAFLATAIVLALTGAITREARAGCNAIPDAASVTGDTQVVPGLIGFKGALGRVDRLHLLPTEKPSIRVQPDGICVNGADGAMPIVRPVSADVNIEDYAVSLLVQPASGRAFARILGTKEACQLFVSDKSGTGTDVGMLVGCDAIPPEVERADGRLNIRIPLPGDGNLFQVALGNQEPMTGTVTIVVTRTPADTAKHKALLQRIGAEGCAKSCGELLESGALACVDTIYHLTSDGTFEPDPIPCDVGTATLAKNDFKAQCENAQAYSDLASCDDTPTVLRFWQDRCGGIHIPVDWKGIRQDTSGNPITRFVAGRSGTARANGQNNRVWIPGREFLGSTPYADPQGTQETTDWRFPNIGAWYPNEVSAEAGLRGSTDQDDSIVHVFPRMPVWIVCDGVPGEEACMSVEGREHGKSLNCACEDRYAQGCTCTKLASPRYFACDGGDFDGMPCTRHAHCNSLPGGKPNGKCTMQPTCQPRTEAGVWKPGRTHQTGRKCSQDEACIAAGPKHWCGYRLFDFDHLQRSGVIELDAQIEDKPGARARRGACQNNPKQFCSNFQPNKKACGAQEGICKGYTLRAEGK